MSVATVLAVAAGPTDAHTAATHLAAERPTATAPVAAAPESSPPAPPPPPKVFFGSIRLDNNASKEAPGSFAETSAAKNACNDDKACFCMRGLRTRPSAAGSTKAHTCAAASGNPAQRTTEADSAKARDASAMSLSLTRLAASDTSATASGSRSAAAWCTTNASSAVKLACRSGRFAFLRNVASSLTMAGATAARSGSRLDCATSVMALIAASRVISFPRRSSSSPRTLPRRSPMASPSAAAATPTHVMAASLTSWSWSAAATRASAASTSTTTCVRAPGATGAAAPPGRRMGTSAEHTRIASAATL
mmetsp:Transcript_23821/g.59049  ORF Transcript_23821/g.59049 Transcript_23821/m.59049 type:complete len:307 (+) Transcript_23821:1568-2488(+)